MINLHGKSPLCHLDHFDENIPLNKEHAITQLDSDDELDPNEFANLIDEYTSVIKREKARSSFLRALMPS